MSSARDNEVELRGRLSEAEAQALTIKLDEVAAYQETRDRIFVDYSVFIKGENVRERQRDVRIRTTNGQPEIIAKLGAWGANEQRQELSVLTRDTGFDHLAAVMAALNYTKGIYGHRVGRVYLYKDCEIVINKVENHSYYFEIEKMADEKGKDDALVDIQNVCRELQLQTFSKEEFYLYVEDLNKTSNGVYDANSAEPDYFAKKYGV